MTGSGVWTTLSAQQTGSVHVRDDLPLQDAVLTWDDGETAVIAVADGHGHHAHFRSDIGARLAVSTAVEQLRERLADLAAVAEGDAASAERIVRDAAIATVADWQAAVEQDVADHPFDPGDPAEADPVLPYGTTLLVAAAAGAYAVFWQIGDGDTVLVDGDDVASHPVPEDPELDGPFTTSLCQPDPVASIRTGVAAADGVALAFLATDGFGRPQADATWWRQTGGQLAGFGRDNGWGWVAEHLPGWLEEPAQIGGDDTTMAVLARTVSRPAAC